MTSSSPSATTSRPSGPTPGMSASSTYALSFSKMSTRGEMVRIARSAVSRWVDAGVVVIRVAILEPPSLRSALDRDLLRRRFGGASELHPENAVGICRLGPIGVEALVDAHGPGERAERTLPSVIALLGHARLRLPLTADRRGVADDGDVEARAIHARAQRLEGDALVVARDVNRRIFAGERPEPGGRNI